MGFKLVVVAVVDLNLDIQNRQVQKISLKSETLREKLCSIFTENRS